MHTRIFGVISGCQLTFGFGQVEWTTVYLCIAGYQIDDKGNHCRDMAFEKEPAVGLTFYDFRKLHGIGQYDNGENAQSDRQFITDHLCTASHGTD